MAETQEHLPGEDTGYRLTLHIKRAIQELRQAEDIARMELPTSSPTADRIRDIYEQVSEDVLNGKSNIPPLKQRLAEAETLIEQLLKGRE